MVMVIDIVMFEIIITHSPWHCTGRVFGHCYGNGFVMFVVLERLSSSHDFDHGYGHLQGLGHERTHDDIPGYGRDHGLCHVHSHFHGSWPLSCS
jgi:hypothetical protein